MDGYIWMLNFRSSTFLDLTKKEIQHMLTFLIAQVQTHCHQQYCTMEKSQHSQAFHLAQEQGCC